MELGLVVTNDEALISEDHDGRSILHRNAELSIAVDRLSVVPEDFRHKLVNLGHEVFVVHCPFLLHAVEQGVDEGLVQPDLLSLLLANKISTDSGVWISSSDTRASEKTIDIELDLLFLVAELRVARHRQVKRQS